MTTPIPQASAKNAKPRPRTDRSVVSAIITYALVVVCALIPVPYLIELPGPVFNTLGDYEGKPVMEISGAQTYDTTGQLDMLTVGVAGGPGRALVSSQVLWSVIRGSETVIPTEAYYPVTTTRDTVTEENAAQMASSQDTATAAALNQLHMDYSVNLLVGTVTPGTPADGHLEPGDVIRSVNGEKLTGDTEGITRLQESAAKGEELTLAITRKGKDAEVSLTPVDDGTGPKIGIGLAQAYDFPIDVTFNVADVGGPSAGLVFSLTMIDKLTPGDLVGDKKIAGTGTITPEGEVGMIGGARQKVVAAAAAGNEFFFSPAGNCAEVLAAQGSENMQIVRVDTLDSAVDSLDKIAAGDVADLPRCEAQSGD